MEEKGFVLDTKTMRSPLRDASHRINNCLTPTTDPGAIRDGIYFLTSPDQMSLVDSPVAPKGNVDRLCISPAVDCTPGSKRNSAVSAGSIVSGRGKRKTHVGPWQLGRTLGSGATGRVRLAKHAVTGQAAAIKIVSKKSAAISQSDSIAAMDRQAGNFIGTGTRQMPSGIEREVVIMKLIEHANVISLYDVWENRGELYLVLEYVEGGELFDYVQTHGPLPEEEAVRLFRQIIAGLGYCHRFNICHRDLKPENILLDANHNVKLADFGMAALQPAGHWLNTSCGSPHYAAPEIIYGRKYQGDKADLWSCGIILYALLTGFLPFDGGDVCTTLKLVRKGDYVIPPNLSREAADLIQRILQKRPDSRIRMDDIWKHPLLKKYERFHQAIANHYIGPASPLQPQDYGMPVAKHDLDVDLLRNLQTLWHDVRPEELLERLLRPEPTQERMFYNALVKFRNEQLENYQGQPLEYSASDYHHISKGQVRLSKHTRNRSQCGSWRRSQFPVIKETGKRKASQREPMSSGTVQSYDPFRSPINRPSDESPQFTRITIHRNQSDEASKQTQPEAPPPSSNPFLDHGNGELYCSQSPPFTLVRKRKKGNSVKSLQSKASYSGSRRGLNPNSTPRSASYKRNVCFRHNRNRSHSSMSVKAQKTAGNIKGHPSENSFISTFDGDPFSDLPSSPMLPAQPTVVRGMGITIKQCPQSKRVRHCDIIWRDEARKVSHELSQICEEAFNGSSMSTGCTDSTYPEPETPATSVSITSTGASNDHVARGISAACPTPQSPGGSPKFTYPSTELAETRRKLIEHSKKDGSGDLSACVATLIGHLDRLIEHDQAMQRGKLAQKDEAWSSTNDLYGNASMEPNPLPIISEENQGSAAKTAHKTADPKLVQKFPNPHASTNRRSHVGQEGKRSVRMVPDSSLHSINDPKPLTIRKTRPEFEKNGTKFEVDDENTLTPRALSSTQGRNPCGLDPIDEAPVSQRPSDTRTSDHKKWSWFRRSQASEENMTRSSRNAKPLHPSSATVIVHEINHQMDTPKVDAEDRLTPRKSSPDTSKGGFLRKLIKRKTNRNARQLGEDIEIAATNPLLNQSPDSEHILESEDMEYSSPRKSRLEGKNQNWFARVFQFKPATRVIALNTSKVKGRKEVYKMLCEWKQYGVQDIHLDKPNSIIYGKIGESNFLHLRPVEFSADFYTVIEDGRQANLSIVRFKQERGAASSFHKVVDTLYMAMKQRGLLVEDSARANKMAQVLDAFPSS
ncbi:hypothetical protein P175DRAFT_0442907 [Aspergillus ochraceoroseus IBT 24754]|uniref:non-specific serine/threonine protein kinase n=3 Tax=Aspergillus subgen. Nidulantes TaxID=2720870 RepID=A0A0F8TXD6_9EURO|nr:uncharacterized protein P175DRAFT_0442907 [Aspergillus ochraceoroseus IBT 24754]KKK12033.1 hypothetical protein ARAM_004996 [Aspergillus rambellii]KKK25288.1 hypothetical protein AOCH_005042 [Aspergillus ochraceoroseus]PTU18919.1 hypothetical protein P175DRAFT_0442907 [Aspergillus ochraceoroseus IBT 24754]